MCPNHTKLSSALSLAINVTRAMDEAGNMSAL